MKCDHIRDLISPMIDGELDVQDEKQVNEHLRECSACHRYWSELTAVDQDLRQLELPSLSFTGVSDPAVDVVSKKSWLRWTIALAVAASGLIAIVLLQNHFQQPEIAESPIRNETDSSMNSTQNVVSLIHRTGPVETILGDQWSPVNDQQSLALGSRIRTSAESLCELRTSDGTVIRVDAQSEIVFYKLGEVALVSGRVYVHGGSKDSITLMIYDNNEVWEAQCPEGVQVQVSHRDDQLVCDMLSEHNLQWKKELVVVGVNPGETIRWAEGSDVIRSNHQISRTKMWQLPLIAADGPSESIEDEMNAILKPLLSHVGRTKAHFFDEQQIRALGPDGAVPLLVFALSESSKDDPNQRLQAVSIASDIADDKSIRLLEQLELDEEANISRLATQALRRIQSQGTN